MSVYKQETSNVFTAHNLPKNCENNEMCEVGGGWVCIIACIENFRKEQAEYRLSPNKCNIGA